jgi:hypothetical protein
VAISRAKNEDSCQRYLREGIPHTARVAVTSVPRRVKVVVYDAVSDLAGSTVTRLRWGLPS